MQKCQVYANYYALLVIVFQIFHLTRPKIHVCNPTWTTPGGLGVCEHYKLLLPWSAGFWVFDCIHCRSLEPQIGPCSWRLSCLQTHFRGLRPRPWWISLQRIVFYQPLGLYLFWLFSLVPCFRTYLLPASLFFDKHVLRLTMPRLYFVLFLFSYLPTYLPACMLHIHFCAVILLQYILWPNFFLLLCRVIVAYYTCCDLCSGTLKLQWRSRLLGKRKNAFRTRSSETFATSRHKQC